MKTDTHFEKSLKKYTPLIYIIRYIMGAFILFSLAFILLKFPDNAADGVRNGIALCLEALIPTLYPFMILTNIYINSGLIEKTPTFVASLTEFLFKLPGECASVILFSMIGGLPIGAKMVQKLYTGKIISENQGQRMLYFCINPGPAFVISTVGYYILGRKEIGVLIYLSLVLSSLTTGIISRFLSGEDEYCKESCREKKSSVNFLQTSVSDASKSIIAISSWVIAFSCISEIINNLNVSQMTKVFLQCIAEITNGSRISAEYFSVPVIAGVIGFSGICAHFQIIDSVTALRMKYKNFLVGRIVNGSIATVYCSLFLKWIPIADETFSAGIRPEQRGMSASLLVSVLMIIMAIFFIIGDDYCIRRKEKRKR